MILQLFIELLSDHILIFTAVIVSIDHYGAFSQSHVAPWRMFPETKRMRFPLIDGAAEMHRETCGIRDVGREESEEIFTVLLYPFLVGRYGIRTSGQSSFFTEKNIDCIFQITHMLHDTQKFIHFFR